MRKSKYSDIYSFGIVFLELFVGRISQQKVSKEKNLKEFVQESLDIKNEDFRKIILKCIENNPKDRFQTFDEIIIVLDKIEISA